MNKINGGSKALRYSLLTAMIALVSTPAFADYPERPVTIIVPWGALHMPEIERDLLEQGFELESETTRQIVGWNTIVSALI